MAELGRASARYDALGKAIARKNRTFERPTNTSGHPLPVSAYYGCNTFNFEQMSQKLSSEDMAVLRETAVVNRKLTTDLADRVASAVKEWAANRGATHYCHWFQPQTGATAEKHDSFFALDGEQNAIEQFTGKQLIQSEPDASSFPSGGRRTTFEARGYTAWDASSPMFLMETDNGLTLCIPSVFISYGGEALDKKTPLLRSVETISKSAVAALKLLGQEKSDYVIATCGPEQEYFVVDEALYALRPDLVLTGRTLIGRPPPKGQQLDDHYFGAMKPRILNFIMECEHELYKLGVPCKTRHNEVAPSQCEAAPIFEFANVAADHNQVVMELIRSVARRHDLVALFHEKPYSDMNGSGKHLNWSLSDSNGSNLLNPGDNPEDNVRFLYFLTAVVKGVHDWAGLLRSSIASAGNDFRLGANEAPPAIISVFLGETLTGVLESISGTGSQANQPAEINLDLAKVPVVARDNTDRNRTSPFAFTGNKFEFRALGSSQSISMPITLLNAAVADALNKMNEELRSLGGDTPKKEQILQVVKQNYLATKKVCFEGNNYDEAWHREAESRGLPNLKDTPTALATLKEERCKKMLTELKIFNSEDELDSRYNVLMERYNKLRIIELETLLELVSTHVLPAAMSQVATDGQAIESSKDILGKVTPAQKKAYEHLVQTTDTLLSQREKLQLLIDKVADDEDLPLVGKVLATDGMQVMEEVRASAGTLEGLVDDSRWSLPRYRELVFVQ